MTLASLVLTFALSIPPLEVIVFDNSLQRVVGYGQQTGDQLRLELQEDYNGPVVSMIVRDKVGSVPGMLTSGQLTLNTQNGSSTMDQYLDTLGINLKLTVVKTPKITIKDKNVPTGNQGEGSDNRPNNQSNSGSNSGSGSGNSGSNSGSGSGNSGSGSGGKGKNK